jgi:hypothetical protein
MNEPNRSILLADQPPESVRLDHLLQESNVKSVGQLCYLVAFFSTLGTLEFALFLIGVIPRDDLEKVIPGTLLDLFFGVFTVGFALNTLAQVAIGFGLIRLQQWARWTVIVLTAISLFFGTISSLILCVSPESPELLQPLLGFRINSVILGLVSLVVGGAIHVLIVWPMVAPGSGVVFSKEYREVIRQTPQIRSRMHWLLKVFIGVLMILVVGFVGFLVAIYFRIID